VAHGRAGWAIGARRRLALAGASKGMATSSVLPMAGPNRGGRETCFSGNRSLPIGRQKIPVRAGCHYLTQSLHDRFPLMVTAIDRTWIAPLCYSDLYYVFGSYWDSIIRRRSIALRPEGAALTAHVIMRSSCWSIDWMAPARRYHCMTRRHTLRYDAMIKDALVFAARDRELEPERHEDERSRNRGATNRA